MYQMRAQISAMPSPAVGFGKGTVSVHFPRPFYSVKY